MDKFNLAKNSAQILVCRIKRYSTLLSQFSGVSVSNYNEVFILGDDITPVPLPSSTPIVSMGAFQKMLVLSNEFAGIKEYSISCDDFVSYGDRISFPVEPISVSSGISAAGGGSIPLKGNTTYNANHRHEYIIDVNGNGVAKETCHPQHANICHSHEIINGIVQPASSKSISRTQGIPSHIHNIRRTALPAAARTTRSTTSRSGAATTRRARTSTRTTTSGGGGGY